MKSIRKERFQRITQRERRPKPLCRAAGGRRSSEIVTFLYCSCFFSIFIVLLFHLCSMFLPRRDFDRFFSYLLFSFVYLLYLYCICLVVSSPKGFQSFVFCTLVVVFEITSFVLVSFFLSYFPFFVKVGLVTGT